MTPKRTQSMTQRLQQALSLIESLPESVQDRLATLLLDAIQQENFIQKPKRNVNILDLAEEARAGVPENTWDKIPTDLAAEHDHYLYGSPKRFT